MLTKEQVDQYVEDGFIIIDNLFSKAELQPVMDEIAELVDELAEELYANGLIKQKYEKEDFYTRLTAIEQACPGASVKLHMKGRLRPEVGKIWSHSRLLDIVEQFIGPDIADHPVWNIRCKTPDNQLATVPWHQDTAYLLEGAEKTLQPTAWIPLIDANSTNGTLKVIKGGHKVNTTVPHYPEREAGNKQSWYLNIKDEHLPKGQEVTCEMPMGSVLFINQLIPHASTENHSDKIRWSIDLRWQNPNKPSGIEAVDCILMKTSKDPDYQVKWPDWMLKGREEIVTNKSDSKNGKSLEVDIDGPWLDRWIKKEVS